MVVRHIELHQNQSKTNLDVLEEKKRVIRTLFVLWWRKKNETDKKNDQITPRGWGEETWRGRRSREIRENRLISTMIFNVSDSFTLFIVIRSLSTTYFRLIPLHFHLYQDKIWFSFSVSRFFSRNFFLNFISNRKKKKEKASIESNKWIKAEKNWMKIRFSNQRDESMERRK